jgi:hypothetical protein
VNESVSSNIRPLLPGVILALLAMLGKPGPVQRFTAIAFGAGALLYGLFWLLAAFKTPGLDKPAAPIDPATLPDDYLMFTMDIGENGLEGRNDYI